MLSPDFVGFATSIEATSPAVPSMKAHTRAARLRKGWWELFMGMAPMSHARLSQTFPGDYRFVILHLPALGALPAGHVSKK
jgi:hypothetical protein